jgi:hypothetical protein
MGTGGVEASYKSVYVSVGGEMTKVRQLCLGPIKLIIEGSAWEFGRQVTQMVGNRTIAEAIFGTNGANTKEKDDMLLGMMDALSGDEPVREKIPVVMSRNGNRNGRNGNGK